jgi:4-alpha-glucanotransferase
VPEPHFPPALAELARLWGIQTAYRDAFGRRRAASPAALLACLRALGVQVDGIAGVDRALQGRQVALITRFAPPVTVAWGARAPRMDLHVDPGSEDDELRCRLTLEDGEIREWGHPLRVCEACGELEAFGVRRVVRRLVVPGRLPLGYHRLALSLGGSSAETLLVCAPPTAPRAPSRGWGGFLPVYALRSERNWGIGDLTDLRALLDWTRSLGGSMTAALPFFATFYDDPFDPSPYSPATRLFWNEIHIDVTQVPELAASPEARDLLASPALAAELAGLRATDTVQYQAVMARKRQVLELLAGAVARDRQTAFEAFAASDPLLDEYARFRGACDRLGRPWTRWPAGPRDGRLSAGDVDQGSYRYHRYVQWIVQEQLEGLADKGGSGPLYLDLPIGANPAGFDVWRHRECFVVGASAGAPPDAMFTKGQVWGFPPMHPEGIRQTGYRYTAECFRRMLRYAGVLRIDHVMGLHRLFMIPPGLQATQGAYLRYRAEELYAVLVLEAHRAGAVVLGEDLGTVPGYVRTAMDRHDVHHSYVVEYELAGGGKLRPPGGRDVAGINTHDMATFAAFWTGAEIAERIDLGLLGEEDAAGEREQRSQTRHLLVELLRGEGLLGPEDPSTQDVLRALLAYLASSEAPVVVVNLEDLWLEESPQNVPGTMDERPNWRRKARCGLDEIRASPAITALLEEVDRHRRKNAE